MNPPQLAPSETAPADGHGSNPQLQSFLINQPKSLGIIQIMIGVVTFFFGIVLTVNRQLTPVSVIAGIVFWAPLFYIVTGSLSVEAENKLHLQLVKGSLSMNSACITISATAFSFLIVDCIIRASCTNCGSDSTSTIGITGVLAALSFLQFIISICITVFAGKAICCHQPAENNTVQNPTMKGPPV